MEKIILHCDLNNFFASVECLSRPDLKDLPVAVSGNPQMRHGIILAKNPLAKSFGIKTGQTLYSAKQMCKNLVVLPPSFEKYLYYSRKVFEIYQQFSNFIEPFGIDECWLDISNLPDKNGGITIANEIKDAVRNELGLTLSVGVSYNKIFAKLGSDLAPNDSIYNITSSNYKTTVWPLDIRNLLFVGPATGAKLNGFGVHTIGNLASLTPRFLQSTFGKNGITLYNYANGLDASPVAPANIKPMPKSIGNSTTCPYDLTSSQQANNLILGLCEMVSHRMRVKHLLGNVLHISIKDKNLCTFTHQIHLENYTHTTNELYTHAKHLFTSSYNVSNGVRSIGVCMSNFIHTEEGRQLTFFKSDYAKLEELDTALDTIKNRYGNDSIFRGVYLMKDGILNHLKKAEGLQKVAFLK